MGFRRFLRRVVRKAENFGRRAVGGSNIGQQAKDDAAAAAAKGPQFTDQARQVAAGAGTVGFTQRTQNY